ncbi:hypothetical protein KKC88_03800 [Patescibacteria group bacterium]|nr:hypothetical protein [Patescibacteria group bacterium]MBU1673455.1 hypothetical protein [Patescibacteria group bacterium]MBU1963278.1 hypothetical protein [Patescibacteria group bacterium]
MDKGEPRIDQEQDFLRTFEHPEGLLELNDEGTRSLEAVSGEIDPAALVLAKENRELIEKSGVEIKSGKTMVEIIDVYQKIRDNYAVIYHLVGEKHISVRDSIQENYTMWNRAVGKCQKILWEKACRRASWTPEQQARLSELWKESRQMLNWLWEIEKSFEDFKIAFKPMQELAPRAQNRIPENISWINEDIEKTESLLSRQSEEIHKLISMIAEGGNLTEIEEKLEVIKKVIKRLWGHLGKNNPTLDNNILNSSSSPWYYSGIPLGEQPSQDEMNDIRDVWFKYADELKGFHSLVSELEIKLKN